MFEILYGNLATILIGLAVLGMVALAVRSIWRNKKQGKCCGSCSGCSGCSAGCHGSGKIRGTGGEVCSGNQREEE
ncbi:MAG: FeoB-associated Cys-rich membrane protein [Lachnospiraceae bacterium]|nr:FeoB-associated Cys-rich membrane protein [Lachnospiraceae bacterium]